MRVLFFSGNHVTIAKRYRKIAQEKGLLVTFTEKVKRNTNIDKLVGGALTYVMGSWKTSRIDLFKEMKSLGIQSIVNAMGSGKEYIDYPENNLSDILISTYDIYQDTSIYEYYEKGWISWNDRWIKETYPNDLFVNSEGELLTAWSVQNLSNPSQMVDCYCPCDACIPYYAKLRYEDELARNLSYGARFIDGDIL
ncbi:Carbohydrate binding domain protein [Histomonas meleagridis]|uniref:Carbohydrate binding domain protein n=1 Tax=Histomonas meleagridis TaxID=135588 RepID=UPI0035596424|nr:Carbohydrate binding domain protein [Histomonas meleagridis]KAH0803417.1 Carbohydrate binding domain protein [Histomonas meleagridis]